MNKSLRKDYKLVLVGFRGWNNKKIMKELEELKDDVIYLGYVSNTELGQLYNLATLFVCPSFYEGFGLPPLEAMSCGCPVVTSNTASLPEVCGDAAYYVDPYDVDSIAEGISRVVTDEELRNGLSKKGLANAAKFSWAKSAQEHLKVFKEAIGR
jgi:glycosyltransferase involved in cell wall biosynthesis